MVVAFCAAEMPSAWQSGINVSISKQRPDQVLYTHRSYSITRLLAQTHFLDHHLFRCPVCLDTAVIPFSDVEYLQIARICLINNLVVVITRRTSINMVLRLIIVVFFVFFFHMFVLMRYIVSIVRADFIAQPFPILGIHLVYLGLWNKWQGRDWMFR